jgi:hypothetical protein
LISTALANDLRKPDPGGKGRTSLAGSWQLRSLLREEGERLGGVVLCPPLALASSLQTRCRVGRRDERLFLIVRSNRGFA